MNPHALAVLEFGTALEAVAARAASESGRKAILSRRPGSNPGEISRELGRVAETMRILSARPSWGPPPFPDAGGGLATLRVEGGVLDPMELRGVCDLLTASRLLAIALAEAEGEASESEPGLDTVLPHLGALRSLLPQRVDLEASLDRIVDEGGELRDGASSELRSVRGRIRSARGRVVRRLDALLAALPERFRVEDASVSVREGRYVVPVRREGKGEVGGIIHGESATGTTLFIEPPLAMQFRNELHELEREEAAEIQRILREATGRLRSARDELASAFEALVDFDTLHARARVAGAWDGTPPELLQEGDQRLAIVGGRHPLLIEQGVEVVPFDLDLEPDERAVVISGPNTGGKTVLLKAIGLIHLLAQSGIVPPVRVGTRLPIVEDVFADIGDEQSLSASLSTFSAHLANVREILEGAGPRTLVLVDEMGTGTDPAEGAALARALLEVLVEQGARALVTSHLGALKRLDAEGSGIINASLLFDAARITPTYQLRKGRPGRSYGLAIARGLGLSPRLIDRAEAYVDSGELRLEALLEALERKERDLSGALAVAEEARVASAEMQKDVAERSARLHAEERQAEGRAREAARLLLLEAREEVESAIREVREAGEAGVGEAAGAARARVEAAARALGDRGEGGRGDRRSRSRSSVGVLSVGPGASGGAGPQASPGGRGSGERALSAGDAVRLRETGAQGVVREVGEDRVHVEVGVIRIDLPLDAVERVGRAPAPGKAGREPAQLRWSGPTPEVRLEADLRGLRVDEVELALGRALDGAVVGNLPELRVIHGFGTGAVKARVRQLLSEDPRVESCRSGGEGEGGAGVTVAVFR